MQVDDDVHATLFRKLPCPPERCRVDWMCQVVPSHRSASVTGPELPTAVQAEDEAQATLFRKLSCPPEGLGVDRMLHFVPFHRSTRVATMPERFT